MSPLFGIQVKLVNLQCACQPHHELQFDLIDRDFQL